MDRDGNLCESVNNKEQLLALARAETLLFTINNSKQRQRKEQQEES
jgi:hypothetical protein